MSDNDNLKTLLDSAVERINRPEFINADPVQFPRRFTSLGDIEIAALLCSHIAWGNRKMICNNCNRLLEIMENSPARYVAEGAFEDVDSRVNIHRTFFGADLKYFLRGLKRIINAHGTIENFAVDRLVGQSEMPSWALAAEINRECELANVGKEKSIRCLPGNLESTALKRLNMALRWLVRTDEIVDMGVWTALKPSQLFIPLDVHVADTSRSLGLLSRKSNDRKAVVELTDKLRRFNPQDPVIYDFALFGLGVE